MIDYNKPPLGVKPAELHAEERAKELADAMRTEKGESHDDRRID